MSGPTKSVFLLLRKCLPNSLKPWFGRQLRNLIRTEVQFRPCTPNVLPALCKGLTACKENNILSNSGYYEFGCYAGFSIWFSQQYCQSLNCDRIKFYGFDSFEGLPEITANEDKKSKFTKGSYAVPYDTVCEFIKNHDSDLDNIQFFKGFYSEDQFKEIQSENSFPKASVVLVDCDLYASTIPVLEFIKPLLQDGSIILFDDYNCFNASDDRGERKAYREFLEKYPGIKSQEFDEFGWHGKSFRIKLSSNSI